ncbi:hypothetical protein ACLOJK_031959 [Asimina triloba]
MYRLLGFHCSRRAGEEHEKEQPRPSTGNLDSRFLRPKRKWQKEIDYSFLLFLLKRKGSVFVFVFVSLDLEKMNKKPGDWNCRSCQHLNFSRRDSCQRCGDPRTGDRGDFGSFGSGRGGTSFGFSGSDVRPGDWYCSAGNCGTHNFASRSSCFKCGAFKDESGGSFDGDSRSRGGAFGFSGRSSLAAMSTTSRVGRNASDAMHLGTMETDIRAQDHNAFASTSRYGHQPTHALQPKERKPKRPPSYINIPRHVDYVRTLRYMQDDACYPSFTKCMPNTLLYL